MKGLLAYVFVAPSIRERNTFASHRFLPVVSHQPSVSRFRCIPCLFADPDTSRTGVLETGGHLNVSFVGNATEAEESEVCAVARRNSTEELQSESSWGNVLNNLPPQPVLLLNMVAIIWGSQHAVIKTIVDDSDPGAFTLLRFGLAALVASPYTPGISGMLARSKNETEGVETDQRQHQSVSAAKTWRYGAELGFYMFLGFSFQAIGLEFTTAQKSGFLLYLNVKFVPFFARIFLGRNISNLTWLSALTAFTGTALLAVGPDMALEFNRGDAWSIAAAMASAMFILRLERASAEVPNSASLNSACLWVVAALAGLWTIAQSHASIPRDLGSDLLSIATKHPFELIYLGGVATALANWIQSKAQKDISAERASVIYAMDPVYGAIFSWWLLGENLNGITGWVGAGLIAAAAATNAFLDLSGSNEVPALEPEIEKLD